MALPAPVRNNAGAKRAKSERLREARRTARASVVRLFPDVSRALTTFRLQHVSESCASTCLADSLRPYRKEKSRVNLGVSRACRLLRSRLFGHADERERRRGRRVLRRAGYARRRRTTLCETFGTRLSLRLRTGTDARRGRCGKGGARARPRAERRRETRGGCEAPPVGRVAAGLLCGEGGRRDPRLRRPGRAGAQGRAGTHLSQAPPCPSACPSPLARTVSAPPRQRQPNRPAAPRARRSPLRERGRLDPLPRRRLRRPPPLPLQARGRIPVV